MTTYAERFVPLATRLARARAVRYGLSAADAGDMLSEAYLALVLAERDYSPDLGRYATYAWCKIEGRLQDNGRLSMRRGFTGGRPRGCTKRTGRPPMGSEEEGCKVPDKAPRPDEVHERAEMRRQARVAIERLPSPTDRRYARMVWVEGRSHREAADALGISKSWGSRMHHRIIARLSNLITL
jgi:RNA polymerase sigma factor (sigma-70 family)